MMRTTCTQDDSESTTDRSFALPIPTASSFQVGGSNGTYYKTQEGILCSFGPKVYLDSNSSFLAHKVRRQ